MVDADKVLAGALCGLVALELEDGEVDHAVGQEHALSQRAVELDDLLEAHRLLVESAVSHGSSTLRAMWRIRPLVCAVMDGLLPIGIEREV